MIRGCHRFFFLLVLTTGDVCGQSSPLTAITTANQADLSFRFDRPAPGVLVPHYSFQLQEDGTATYHAETMVAGATEPRIVDRSFTFAPSTIHRAFAAVEEMRSSSTPCASKLKNIADTGIKTVVAHGPRGEVTCTFNFTENKGAMHVAELFEGVELTLEAGRALDFKRRFDRLGLDAEMAGLASAAEDGRAQGLEAIEPTLRAIAADTELIERVRITAGKLLDRAGTR